MYIYIADAEYLNSLPKTQLLTQYLQKAK